MFVVRYAALIALVLWIAALLRGAAWIASGTDVGLACGGALVVLLFVQKFIGPPPASFVPRLAIVAVMIALALWTRRTASSAVNAVELALAAVLLGWYGGE